VARKEPVTLLIVPDDGAGEVRQVSVDLATLRRAGLAAGALLGVLLAGTVYGVASGPRAMSHTDLVAENLELREQLHEIETQLDSIDATLERVELYDAQLRDLIDQDLEGGFGPLDDDEVEALGLVDTGEAGWDEAQELPTAADDLRPAEAWAREVSARTDAAVASLERLEPQLGLLAEDLEDMLSIQSSFPQVWPAEGIFTSGFGYRRSPITGGMKFHSGIDIAAPRGTPVVATAPGVVIMADYNSGYGRMVEIDHGYGIISRYAHNSSVFVAEGEWVEAGQIISTIGTTGQTTGPHLHFELLVNGQAVDPLEYLEH
jgi:murein DD-endopeptidase MepM/ murein hydrolase activator NlpD